jgi:hypothetical protein
MVDGVDGEEVQVGPSLAETASSYFIKASVKCPAAPVGQGAFIALSCKDENQDPAELKHALISDDSALRKIAEAANRSHNAHPDTLSPQRVNRSLITNVLDRDFLIAETLMPLPQEELGQLCGEKYEEYKAESLGMYPEGSQNRNSNTIKRINYVDDKLERDANAYLRQAGLPHIK